MQENPRSHVHTDNDVGNRREQPKGTEHRLRKRRWTQHRHSSVVALHLRSPTTHPPSSLLQRGRICGVEGLDGVALDVLEKADVCDRPNVSYLRLPRQPASANGATTLGFSGPFPSQCVEAAHADTRVPFCFWQLGRSLFGMPAQGPSRPLVVGFRLAALDSVRHCKVAGGH